MGDPSVEEREGAHADTEESNILTHCPRRRALALP